MDKFTINIPGIGDYKVVCDESNNPPDIDHDILKVDFYIRPFEFTMTITDFQSVYKKLAEWQKLLIDESEDEKEAKNLLEKWGVSAEE